MRVPPQENAFTRAAADLDVPVAELKLWLMETVDPSPEQWSHWKYDRRPIAPEHIVAFLKVRKKGDAQRQQGIEQQISGLMQSIARVLQFMEEQQASGPKRNRDLFRAPQ